VSRGSGEGACGFDLGNDRGLPKDETRVSEFVVVLKSGSFCGGDGDGFG